LIQATRRDAMSGESRVSYFLVGLGVGAAISVVFAPKSGKDTREFVALKAEEGKKRAQDKVREVRVQAEDLVERGKEFAASISGAVKAGRDAYQQVMSEPL
jgi:gas vesicle protein